jgi:hypothetical protein
VPTRVHTFVVRPSSPSAILASPCVPQAQTPKSTHAVISVACVPQLDFVGPREDHRIPPRTDGSRQGGSKVNSSAKISTGLKVACKWRLAALQPRSWPRYVRAPFSSFSMRPRHSLQRPM